VIEITKAREAEKYFNVTGTCYSKRHYMVDLTERLEKIKKLVDRGEYFVISRARQYGKTTTLKALEQYLRSEYIVLSLSFQRMSTAKFQTEFTFAAAFAEELCRSTRKKTFREREASIIQILEKREEEGGKEFDLVALFNALGEICALVEQPVVLMVDEIDSASNNQIFLDFLAQLRDGYLEREELATFHSVILAGVYDIRNLKLKIRPEEEHKYNSPWNVAAEFDLDMSFSIKDISGMLAEYEAVWQTGMEVKEIAELLYEYTSGYPFLVSWLCKYIDETLVGIEGFPDKRAAWSKAGILEAVKAFLNTPNTLIDDMRKKIADYSELREMLYTILFSGQSFPFNPDHTIVEIGMMFGFIKNVSGRIAVANRIFETRLYNLFLSEELIGSKSYAAGDVDKNQFVKNGRLNMELVLRKFVKHFTEVYSDSNEGFLEENGRRFFLLYLKPIINGVGNYYVEAQTRDRKRTDVIVDYRGQQYVIEMKIWHGEEYNQRGKEQLAAYLKYYQLEEGYLLSFNFNKKKMIGVKEIYCEGKRIIEAVV
jgi:hypothetical protein